MTNEEIIYLLNVSECKYCKYHNHPADEPCMLCYKVSLQAERMLETLGRICDIIFVQEASIDNPDCKEITESEAYYMIKEILKEKVK